MSPVHRKVPCGAKQITAGYELRTKLFLTQIPASLQCPGGRHRRNPFLLAPVDETGASKHVAVRRDSVSVCLKSNVSLMLVQPNYSPEAKCLWPVRHRSGWVSGRAGARQQPPLSTTAAGTQLNSTTSESCRFRNRSWPSTQTSSLYRHASAPNRRLAYLP